MFPLGYRLQLQRTFLFWLNVLVQFHTVNTATEQKDAARLTLPPAPLLLHTITVAITHRNFCRRPPQPPPLPIAKSFRLRQRATLGLNPIHRTKIFTPKGTSRFYVFWTARRNNIIQGQPSNCTFPKLIFLFLIYFLWSSTCFEPEYSPSGRLLSVRLWYGRYGTVMVPYGTAHFSCISISSLAGRRVCWLRKCSFRWFILYKEHITIFDISQRDKATVFIEDRKYIRVSAIAVSLSSNASYSLQEWQRARDCACGLAQFFVFSLISSSLVRPGFCCSVYRLVSCMLEALDGILLVQNKVGPKWNRGFCGGRNESMGFVNVRELWNLSATPEGPISSGSLDEIFEDCKIMSVIYFELCRVLFQTNFGYRNSFASAHISYKLCTQICHIERGSASDCTE